MIEPEAELRRGRVEGKETTDRHACHHQVLAAAKVGLDQRAQGVAAQIVGQPAAGAADAAFPAVTDRPGAGADRALLDGTAASALERLPDVLGMDMPALDIIQIAVVGLADDDVNTAAVSGDANLGVLADGSLDQRIQHQADVEGIGQGQRGFQDAQLAHLLETADFAVAVDGVDGGAHLFLVQVAAVR